MKLSQTASRHPWPHPSITLGPAPVCNPSLAGVLSAHSILLMPCRHTANPSPPPVSLDSAETAFAIKKKKKMLSLQTFPPPIDILCSAGDLGCCGATGHAEHKQQGKVALCLEDVMSNGNASLALFCSAYGLGISGSPLRGL